MLSFLPSNVHATSTDLKDQISCQTLLLGTWTDSNSTCTITNFSIGYSDSLTVDNSVYPNITLAIDGTVHIEDSCSKVGCHAGTLTNSGHIVVSNSGTIFSNAIFTSSGTVDNFGIINTNARSALINTGIINNNNGGTITCNPCVGISNGGTINNNAGSIFDVTSFSNSAIFNNYGTFSQNGGDFYNYAGGYINNYGIMNSGYFYNYNVVNNNITGTITNTGTYSNSGTVLNSGTINNNSTGTITNSGVINNLCVGTINNLGTISGNPPINPCLSDTTSLKAIPNPSKAGQQVTFNATVLPSSATGTVIFLNGTKVLGSGTLSGGIATFSTPFNAGSYSITAQYAGDSNYLPSTSSSITQTVNKGGTKLILITSSKLSVFNQTVTFTASVSPIVPANGSPTGTITFSVDGVPQPPALIVFGNAFLVTPALPVGIHTITAQYSGDGNFLSSTSSPLTQTVNNANTKTTLVSSSNPSIFGQKITFTVKVFAASPSSGTPSGNVTFTIDGVAKAPITLSSGKATLSTNALSVGNHTITAQYSGNSNFTGSTSTSLKQSVQRATSISISPSTTTIPHGTSQLYTVTLSDTSPGTPSTPTGMVSWRASLSGGSFSSTTCTLVPISSSKSSCQVTYTAPATTGTDIITGSYSGDSTHAKSSRNATLKVT